MIMRILAKIYEFMWPVCGGVGGAITKVGEIQSATVMNDPAHWHLIFETFLVASIGALVGYIVKHLLDFLLKKIKTKRAKKDI